ncbi:hypothetical protein KO506_06775 [Polaribacter vadi]|uniref:hypothetical protein n=1 Tax=Polaribacter TaxID=52959 RepID=UPI001C09FDAE|nr:MULTISPECIES: hypothetical protein [Polaribacter]MBU3011099.1 hypothetical protein [Polaribacter vadi]MDO6740913.1 hypothetical protein [Polaribacter sp. 1_MG-2023]
MEYKQIGEKYISYFKIEYGEFINELIKEVKTEKKLIDFSKYTSKTAEKPKKITLEFLKKEGIKDHLFTNDVTFSLNYSFYLEFLSHNDRLEIESELLNEIVSLNQINNE